MLSLLKRSAPLLGSVIICMAAIGCRTTTHHTSLQADSLVTAAVEANLISGAVLLVAREGHVELLESYGYAQQYAFGGQPMSSPVPMQTDHIFDLASLTKVFATTLGIMMLVDQDKVALDAPVKTYLPAFSSPAKDSITVRHLLTHSSGLFPWKPTYYHATNKHETFDYISQLELASPVGKSRRYSDLGFMLLGYLIEDVSGQLLDAFLQDELYTKLGLSKTGFTPSWPSHLIAATSHGNPFEKRMVADDNFGYVCDEDPEAFTGWRQRVLIGEVNDGNAFHAHQGMAGHAGLFSTAEELNVLLNLLLNKGMHQGETLISPEIVEQFLTMDEFGNGLGWAMSPGIIYADSPGAFGHTGFTGTYAVAVPEQSLSIILLTNRQHAGVGEDGRYPSLSQLRREVVAAVLGGE